MKTKIHKINEFIYITSDEKPKEGDWTYNLALNIVEKATKFDNNVLREKIILTIDKDLIKDGIQAINDEFLEWICKNPSCEEFEIDNRPKISSSEKGFVIDNPNYNKIIIPKEEIKCTCKEHDPYCCQIHGSCPICVKKEEPKQENIEEEVRDAYNALQERSYSEEEVLIIIKECKSYLSFGDEFNEAEWFNQYKKNKSE